MVKRNHTGYRVPGGARGLGHAERYLDMLNTPSLPLLTLGVKRAGPVFLLGEGEGSQGRTSLRSRMPGGINLPRQSH